MKTSKSIPLSLVMCCGFGVALASLSTDSATESNTLGDSLDLSSELRIELASFDEAQRKLETNLQRASLSTLDQAPEDRRSAMAAWFESHRSEFLAQVARADELDSLFQQHGIVAPPDELTVVESQRPRSLDEATTTRGRQWKLQQGLAEIRQRHQTNPEALRDALKNWHDIHIQELQNLEEELRQELRLQLPKQENVDTAPELVAVLPPVDAPKDVQHLFELQNALADLTDADPPPLEVDGKADFAAMDAWRERVARQLDPVTAKIYHLNKEMSETTLRQIATQARRESAR